MKSQMLKESCPVSPQTPQDSPPRSKPVRPVPTTPRWLEGLELGIRVVSGGHRVSKGLGPGYIRCGIVSLLCRKALMIPATVSGWFKWT